MIALRVLALVLVATAWAPALDAPYQYDDYVTPLKDPASQSIGAWVHALPRTLRPLTKLTYALESSLGATSAPARRTLQVVLFLVSGTLVALLALQVGASEPMAIAFATLWAVHPVHAETWVALAGRSVLLSLCLTLASALQLLRGRRGWAIALAVLALSARETALAWLVVCVALASRRALWTAASFGLGGLAVLASARMRSLLAFSFDDPNALDRLGLQWAALSRGTLMWFFTPTELGLDIELASVGLERLLYVLLTLLMYGGAAWLAWRGPQRVLVLLWLALVLPLHSVVPKLDPLTARSLSASSAPLACLLALLPTRVLWVPAALTLLLGFFTRQRAELYDDPVLLWRDAADRSRHHTRPLINLGTLLAQRGQLPEARAAFVEALRRNPNGTDERERLKAVEVLLDTNRLLREQPAEDGKQEVEPR